MKRFIPVLVAIVLVTPACQHRLPEISLPEVPAAPLVQALETQRQQLRSVKAVARVETERKGRRRSYESVTFIRDGRGRLRIDGFGPLGESLFAVLWDGRSVLFRPPGEQAFRSVGQAGLERALGVALSPADLSAALSGNVVIPQPDPAIRAGCRPDGRCEIRLSGDRGGRRIYALRPAGDPAGIAVAEGEDLYEGTMQVYRGRFEDRRMISGCSFPMTVSLENPDRAVRLVIHYEEVDVNIPVDDALFQEEIR